MEDLNPKKVTFIFVYLKYWIWGDFKMVEE